MMYDVLRLYDQQSPVYLANLAQGTAVQPGFRSNKWRLPRILAAMSQHTRQRAFFFAGTLSSNKLPPANFRQEAVSKLHKNLIIQQHMPATL